MTLKRQYFPYTTSAGGAATVYSNGASAPQNAIIGKLYAVVYLPGTTDTGATVTVTCEGLGSKPLLTKATAGTSNTWFYPRDIQHAVADGAALTGTAGGDRALPVCNGAFKVVIASGGNAAVGAVEIYYDE